MSQTAGAYVVADHPDTRARGLPLFRQGPELADVATRLSPGAVLQVESVHAVGGDVLGRLTSGLWVVLESPAGKHWATPERQTNPAPNRPATGLVARLEDALRLWDGWGYPPANDYRNSMPEGTPGRHELAASPAWADCIVFVAGVLSHLIGGHIWDDRPGEPKRYARSRLLLYREVATQDWWAMPRFLVDRGWARWVEVPDLDGLPDDAVVVGQGARDDGDGQLDQGETGHAFLIVGPARDGRVRVVESWRPDGWGRGARGGGPVDRVVALESLLRRYSDVRLALLE